ncbi:Tryptophan synthase alpha chain [Candidatus Thermoflexus japonica]|uniref:Tryptophan synthase alpha chain n=1 Tax=Candidatus Thermoflexus japonica TaxID=2035417 RepID=A0A2H5Y495_9CHLR|nr:Tryptophan synthase alpha chain [Candidatus Thermoflexus japonica]
MNGIEAVREAFRRARGQGRPALIFYWPVGYPDLEASIRIVAALAQAGADLIELGLPFSDPLADGPVIQRATQRALEGGVRTPHVLEAAARLRAMGVRVPLCVMTYINPVMAWGISRFLAEAVQAGVHGLIVPDLPLEEAEELQVAAGAAGLAWVPLAAPTTPDERLARIAATATGFLYLVSVTGITGARDQLPADVLRHLRRARRAANGVPVALGFGISRPEHVRALASEADGLIIGSALIRLGEASGFDEEALSAFVRALREAIPSFVE